MKIALLTDGIYPFIVGGMQRHSYFIAKYLAQRKINTRVYHCIKSQDEKIYNAKLKEVFTQEELNYLEFIQIPFDFTPRFPGYYLLESYYYSKRIYNHLIKDIHQFDFIYSKGFTAWYLLKNKKHNYPSIGIKLHGYEMYQYAPDIKTRLQHLLLRIPAHYITRKADVVFSYGGKITDILKQKLKIPAERIVEIPTGIEGKLIQPHITQYHTPLSFVFVGRYEKRKGIENLNKALTELLKKNTLFYFHFIGDIPKKLQIQHPQIIYHGKITEYHKIATLLLNSDVLVCPSYSEGMPNVIVEAMANGLTVLATNVGAIPLLVNESTGYLLHTNDANTLKKALQRVISENKEKLQSKKKSALAHITQFTWENTIDILIHQIRKFSPPR